MKDEMTTVESDDVAMEDSGCLGEGAADENADAPPTEKMPSLLKDDDDASTGLSWPELVAQLLVDKQVAGSLSGHGIHSFHLQRSAAGRGWSLMASLSKFSSRVVFASYFISIYMNVKMRL